jgi:hypothetical protein
MNDWFGPEIERPMTGFWNTLTPEQQQKALEYDGDINFGDPAFKRQPYPDRLQAALLALCLSASLVLMVTIAAYSAMQTDWSYMLSLYLEW